MDSGMRVGMSSAPLLPPAEASPASPKIVNKKAPPERAGLFFESMVIPTGLEPVFPPWRPETHIFQRVAHFFNIK